MINKKPLLCDVIPIHPHLKPYESLTSYCIRLGEENRVKSISGLAELLFPESDRRIILDLSDLPPLSVSTISKATNQTPEKIHESTFYNIAKNFSRATQPQSVSRFLKGVVSKNLRFCPMCVQENHHYSILWRFTHIEGCHIHNCKLLDFCPNCGKQIPLFFSPFKILECPFCGGIFSNAKSKPLTSQELSNLPSNIEDLKMFLSNKTYPNNFCVGNILKIYRLYLNIPLNHIANQIQVSIDSLSVFETNRVEKGSLQFSDVLSYIKVINMPFHKIIDLPIVAKPYNETINISTIKSSTQKNKSCKKNGIQKENKHTKENHYNEIEQIKSIIMETKEKIVNSGETFTITYLSEKSKISKNRLYYHPEIRILLHSIIYVDDSIYESSESSILHKIEEIAFEVINSTEKITYSLISNRIQMLLATMLYYVNVRKRIDQLKKEQLLIWENNYLLKVEKMILTNQLVDFSKTNIYRQLGVTHHQIKCFPNLSERIKSLSKNGNISPHKKNRKVASKLYSYPIYNNNGNEIKIFKNNNL